MTTETLAGIIWNPIKRDYSVIFSTVCKTNTEALPANQSHPLSQNIVPHAIKKPDNIVVVKDKEEFFDPLSALSAASPTSTNSSSSSFAIIREEKKLSSKAAEEGSYEEINKNWKSRSNAIFLKYTTGKKISMDIDQEENSDEMDTPRRNSDENFANSKPQQKNAVQLWHTQKEFENQMASFKKKLQNHWNSGEKVNALKIAIQAAKSSSASSVGWFFPAKFVHGVEIIDNLGQYVFERLKEKGLKHQKYRFSSKEVSDDAKEVCKNWIYKISCIRELIPRIYLEVAILSSYLFVEGISPAFDLNSASIRLLKTIRGIGDPIAAIYARSYMCTQLARLRSSHFNAAVDNQTFRIAIDDSIADFLRLLRYEHSPALFKSMSVKVESKAEALKVMSPALSWIFHHAFRYASQKELSDFLQQYEKFQHGWILYHVIDGFPSSFVSSNALKFCDLIVEADMSNFDAYELYRVFGLCISSSLPTSSDRLLIFNKIWKVVTKLSDPVHYIEVASVFTQFVVQCFSSRELNVLLGDIIKHIKPQQAYKDMQTQLSLIVLNMTQQLDISLQDMITMDKLLSFLDLLTEKSLKKGACKSLIHAFKRNPFPLSDSVRVHAFLEIGKSLHDSIDILALYSEKSEVNELISCVISAIDFGNDFEQKLSIYVDFRKAFPNLNEVNKNLIRAVNKLLISAYIQSSSHYSSRSPDFVKACAAFCQITIPSLDDIFERNQLYLESAQAALMNGLVGQAEGLIKAAIASLPLITNAKDEYKLFAWLQSFIGYVLVFPGHPESGPFFLCSGLINAIKNIPIWEKACEYKTKTLLNLFSLFCSFAQNKFIYTISGVDSNDLLFGGSLTYFKEIKEILQNLYLEIMNDFQSHAVEAGTSRDVLSFLALDFINLIVSFMELNESTATLIVKLFRLVIKREKYDNKYFTTTVYHACSQKGEWSRNIREALKQMIGK